MFELMKNNRFSKVSSTTFILILIVTLILTNVPDTIYGATTSPHVIYEVEWLSDNSAEVTLKWNVDTVSIPIRITSWIVNTNNTVTVRYQQGSKVVTGFNHRTITDTNMKNPCVFILEEDLQTTTATQEIFPDLPSNSEGKLAIKHLYYLGIINGYVNGTFGPSGQVSRAEFSKMLYFSGKMSTTLNSPITFTDVNSSHWAKNYIYTLATKDIVKGKGNNIFDPNGTITIGEVLTILDRSFTLYGEGSSYPYSLENHWSSEYFLNMVDKGIVKSTDSYYYPYLPTKIATRQDCAILLSRVLLNFHEVK